jgi:hypothetical protein
MCRDLAGVWEIIEVIFGSESSRFWSF